MVVNCPTCPIFVSHPCSDSALDSKKPRATATEKWAFTRRERRHSPRMPAILRREIVMAVMSWSHDRHAELLHSGMAVMHVISHSEMAVMSHGRMAVMSHGRMAVMSYSGMTMMSHGLGQGRLRVSQGTSRPDIR
jgi:hypothetical protein